MFKINVGGLDCGVWVVVGLVLIGLVVNGNIGVWGYIGFVLLVIGVFGMCLLYLLFGFSSCLYKI